MPSSRCGCSITMTVDSKIFLIAGVDDKSYLMDVWVIDVKENVLTWVLVEESTELKGRYTHEAILIDGKILLLGGGDMEYCADFKTITAFDINIQQFIQIDTLPDENENFGYPTPRKFHSAVKNNSEIFIIGGYSVGTLNNDTENAIIHDDIWKLSQIIIDDNICYKWSKTESKLKIPLFFHTSAVTPEGCVYTFGGCIDTKSMYPSNKLQRFWVQTPGLKQMALFKVLFYNTNLVKKFKNNEIQRLQKLQENNETNEQEVEQNLRELLYTKPNRLNNIIE
uniref:Kelch motif family protein n=1 Tax=Acrobeloides nanus TaxID=290746 RepID=A0A914E3U2_9BILA